MTEMMHDTMWAWMLLWAFVGVAILVLAGVTTIWLARRTHHDVETGTSQRPQVDGPEEVLRRRYAAGEIDEDEYLKRMSGLQQRW